MPRCVLSVRSHRPLGPFRGSCVPRSVAVPGVAACLVLLQASFMYLSLAEPSRAIRHCERHFNVYIYTNRQFSPSFFVHSARLGPPSLLPLGLREAYSPRSVLFGIFHVPFRFVSFRFVLLCSATSQNFNVLAALTSNFSGHARGGSTLLPARARSPSSPAPAAYARTHVT